MKNKDHNLHTYSNTHIYFFSTSLLNTPLPPSRICTNLFPFLHVLLISCSARTSRYTYQNKPTLKPLENKVFEFAPPPPPLFPTRPPTIPPHTSATYVIRLSLLGRAASGQILPSHVYRLKRRVLGLQQGRMQGPWAEIGVEVEMYA